jgi:hypothetical protein
MNHQRCDSLGPSKASPQIRGSEPSFEQPHVIYAKAVYTVEDLRRIFGLKASSVRREVRLRRLRVAKRCGRYFCLGQWVLQWIEGGELRASPGAGDTCQSGS